MAEDTLKEILGVLKDIHRDLSSKIDATNQQLDVINRDLAARIDATNERLDDLTRELRTGLAHVNDRIDFRDRRDELAESATARALRADVDDLKQRVHALENR